MNQPQVSPAIPAAAALGGQLPTSNYWSQQHFEDELEYVFRRSWINICRADEIAKPGDFIVQDLYAIGTSVIVVRGNDGVIRAFHNMCTHRGNRVEVDLQGNKKWFTCLFHGWTYDYEGHLVGLPQSNKFSTVQKDKGGLTPIHVGIWGGFVHICLAEKPPMTIEEFMQPLTKQLGAHYGDQTWHLSLRLSVEVNCNWKLPYDAVIEFYHFNALHPKSIGGGMSLKDSPARLFSEQAGVVGHFEAFYAKTEAYLEPTPVQQLAAAVGASGIHTKSNAIECKTRYPEAINGNKREDWAVDVYATLPHVAYLIQEQSIAVQRAWPIAVDRCHITLDVWTLTPPPRNFAEMFNASAVKSRTADIVVEDFSTLERIQNNLKHGPVRTFHYNADEAQVKGLQDLIQVWIDRGKAAKAGA
jgi:phenylpropionate dioxygenase-like ring-hydroxylating dioxygenase large terminal subunit